MQRQYLVSRSGAADCVQERERTKCAPLVRPRISAAYLGCRIDLHGGSRRDGVLARAPVVVAVLREEIHRTHPRESAPPHCRQREQPSRTRDQATFPETFPDSRI